MNKSKFKSNATKISPTLEEKAALNSLNQDYTKYSEMTASQREFLTALALRTKPKKLLEIGVAAGGSAIIMLNAIKDIENAKLYSIDCNKNYYRDSTKLSGFVVNETCPQFLDK